VVVLMEMARVVHHLSMTFHSTHEYSGGVAMPVVDLDNISMRDIRVRMLT
jgi:DUF1365 family protein